MSNRTGYQIRTAVRQLANVENSKFVKDSEIDDRVNEAVSDLWDLLQSKFEHYGAKTYAFSLSSSNSTPLPSDFYKEILLEKTPGPHSQPIHPVSYLERNFRRGFIVADDLSVWPMSNFAGDYQLTYTPTAPTLNAPTSLTARLATAAPLLCTNSGTGPGATLNATGHGALVVDGASASVNDVVLITQPLIGGAIQLASAGLYQVTNAGSPSTNWGMVRLPGHDSNTTIVPGEQVNVTEGALNANVNFVLASTTVNVDVLPLDYEVVALPNSLQSYYEYIQVAAAITVVEKRGRDSSKLVARLARLAARIEGAAANRTEEAPDMPVTSAGDRHRRGFWGMP